MLGGEVVERQQHVQVVADLRGGFGPFGAELDRERLRRHAGVGLVFGVVDLRQSTFRGWVDRLRQRGEDVADLVPPAPLLGGGGEHVADRLPEPERAVADREHRRLHAATLAVAQQISPRLARFAEPVRERDQLLAAVGADPDHHQQTHLVGLEPDLQVDAVDPHVHVVRPGQRPGTERDGLVLPLRGESG